MCQIESVYGQVGRRLREVRERLGLTQAEVAKRLGMAGVTYHNYEIAQRRVPVVELKRIAALFDVPISYFLGEQLTPEQMVGLQYHALTAEQQIFVRQMIQFLRERATPAA